jgi:hypothetical protein
VQEAVHGLNTIAFIREIKPKNGGVSLKIPDENFLKNVD